jgi:hypothetical protein
VLFEVSDILSYQYWERRYYFYLGIDKKFDFIRAHDFSTGPYLGINELFSFGGYRGSDTNPGNKFITSPFLGWYYSTDYLKTWIGYHFTDYKTPEIKPGRFNIGISLNISLLKNSLKNKKISWLD